MIDGLLHFAKKQSTENILKGLNEKPECENEMSLYGAIIRNYTYTINNECISQLGSYSNNNGVLCKLRKSFLKERLFKIDIPILKSQSLKLVKIILK